MNGKILFVQHIKKIEKKNIREWIVQEKCTEIIWWQISKEKTSEFCSLRPCDDNQQRGDSYY